MEGVRAYTGCDKGLTSGVAFHADGAGIIGWILDGVTVLSCGDSGASCHHGDVRRKVPYIHGRAVGHAYGTRRRVGAVPTCSGASITVVEVAVIVVTSSTTVFGATRAVQEAAEHAARPTYATGTHARTIHAVSKEIAHPAL